MKSNSIKSQFNDIINNIERKNISNNNNIHSKVFHVAVILDGNRRWANNKNLSSFIGHRTGLFAVRKLIAAAIENKISHLTLYAFSKENWRRSESEVQYLMRLFSRAIKAYSKFVIKNDIKFTMIGDRNDINESLLKEIEYLETQTKNNQRITVTAAISYGGRDEIVRAVKKIHEENIEIISETDFEKYIDSAHLPDVDLMIRTSGEQRISNFLLWKISYAELYFINKNWPEFTQKDLQDAINWYKNCKRNFGK